MTDTDLAAARALRAAWDTVRLSETIAHAHSNVPYYRSLWQSLGMGAETFSELNDIWRFPVTRKKMIAADARGFVSEVDVPESVHDTSGTTGRRLSVYSNSAEQEELARLVGARSAGASIPSLVLRLLPPPRRLNTRRAGLARERIGELRLPIIPGYDPNIWVDSVDQFVNVVFDQYLVGGNWVRPDVIHATPPPLLAYLTEQMTARGVDPTRCEVCDLLLTGGFVPDALRDMLSRRWQARVTNSYSCTEIRGDSPECPAHPGLFHPSLSVYAEVLDPDTFLPVPAGSHGELALTGLYPYQQVMPMIRYLPGDIAEHWPDPCSCGAPQGGFRIIGRSGHVVDMTDVLGFRYYIGSNAVQNAIGASVHIPQFPFPRMFISKAGGADSPTRVEIEIEASSPVSFPASAEADRIKRRLLRQNARLGQAVSAKGLKVSVSLVEKGALSEYYRLYPGR